MDPGLAQGFSSVIMDVEKLGTPRSDHDSETHDSEWTDSAGLRSERQNGGSSIEAAGSVLSAAEDTTSASDQASSTVEESGCPVPRKGATTPTTATADFQHDVALEEIHWGTITALDTPPDQIMLECQHRGKYLCLEPYRSWADTL